MKIFPIVTAFIVVISPFSHVAAAESKVAVVGAGLAGLTAAYRLQKLGISAEIFEARNRAGGRAFTYYDGEHFEELGGKNINDGGDATEIKSLAFELGLNIDRYDVPFTKQFLKDGKAYEFYEKILEGPPPTEENRQNFMDRAKNSKTLHELLSWFFKDHPQILQLWEMRISNYEGSSPELLGTYSSDLFWRFYRSTFEDAEKKDAGVSAFFTYETIEGGNSRLVESLCERLKGHLHLNSPLKKIYKQGDQIALEFEGSKTLLFDKVILAIPCPLLQKVEMQDGLIPQDQMDAIKNLQYGTTAKILLPITVTDPAANISYGKDFVTWFNKDFSLITVFFGGYAALFDPSDPNLLKCKVDECKADLKILYPTLEVVGKPIAVGWTHEQYSLGSYSNFGIDLYDSFNERILVFGEEVKKVFRPIEDKIFFAGEHTTLTYYGTLEGAAESGSRAARMVGCASIKSP